MSAQRRACLSMTLKKLLSQVRNQGFLLLSFVLEVFHLLSVVDFESLALHDKTVGILDCPLQGTNLLLQATHLLLQNHALRSHALHLRLRRSCSLLASLII